MHPPAHAVKYLRRIIFTRAGFYRTIGAMRLIDGIAVWGNPEENALAQIRVCAKTAAKAALMADAHMGYSVPIGGVVAYENAVSPSGVGFDIACGNKAVPLDMPADEARRNIAKIMDDVWKTVSFGIGRNNNEPVEHPMFDKDYPGWQLPEINALKRTAANQLGTVGSGNHYVDIFSDECDRVRIGVHFGSRGLGHKIATHFLKAAGGKDDMDAEPCVLRTDTQLGQDYIAGMELAGEYAYAGRDWVCARVAKLLGATILEEVHNHHNFCIPGDQKIPTANGPKRMRDITVGDEVYSYDADQGIIKTRVLRHWDSGVDEVIRIRTRTRELTVSRTHPVLILRTDLQPHPIRKWFNKRVGSYAWVRADNVQEGDVLMCANGYYDTSASIGDDYARLIGAFLGDGWIRNTHPEISGYSVGLAIGGTGDMHVSKYQTLCEELLPYATWKNNAPGAFGLSCSSVDVHTTLSLLGLCVSSPKRQLPPLAYRLSMFEKLALLSGYFDADGSIAGPETSNHGRGTICSASRDLVEGLREIAIACSMQVTPVRREDLDTNFGPGTAYRCVLSADSAARLILWNESKAANQRFTIHAKPEGLEASRIGYLNLPDHAFAQIVTGVTTLEDPMALYDITVEHDSHSFICEGVIVHNCWLEEHDGRKLWVVRKGATPAFPGQRGFVGGSMGDNSVILEGIENDLAEHSLYSTVHGAGRVMGRMEAKGKPPKPGRWHNQTNGTKVWIEANPGRPAKVTQEMMTEWVNRRNVCLRGAGTDESPHCYKRLEEVLAYHAGTVKILHVLTPIGVAMASPKEFDPFKD